MRDLVRCPICHSESLTDFLSTADHFGTQESFSLKKCPSCNGLSTSPQPNEEEIIPYYKANNYISHGEDPSKVLSFIYKTIQKINFHFKKNILLKHSPQKNILDYGCGTGEFLKYLKNKGWESHGIEPDEQAKQLATAKGVEIIDLQDLNKNYDIISLFHVLEHIHQLHETIEKLISHLSADGHLVIALPNYRSHDAEHYHQYWAGYDVPRHLYHFSTTTVNELFQKFGLKIVQQYPMYFDSYYVSLLSEEYKTGKKRILPAFFHGFKSNWSARRTKEYSSIIYVLNR